MIKCQVKGDFAIFDQENFDKLQTWDFKMPPFEIGTMWKCHQDTEADDSGVRSATGPYLLYWYDKADAPDGSLYKEGKIRWRHIVVVSDT